MRLIQYFLVLLASFLSPSNGAAPAPENYRVITQIEVTVVHDGQSDTTVYSESNQMEAILTYLRMTQPTGALQLEPDSFRADSYTFTLHFSDGNQGVYRQIYHDFLQQDAGRWQRIDPKAGLLFPPI